MYLCIDSSYGCSDIVNGYMFFHEYYMGIIWITILSEYCKM